MNRYWDFVDYLIVAFYAFAGIVAAQTYANGGSIAEVARNGFAVAGFGVTLAMALAALDRLMQQHYNPDSR